MQIGFCDGNGCGRQFFGAGHSGARGECVARPSARRVAGRQIRLRYLTGLPGGVSLGFPGHRCGAAGGAGALGVGIKCHGEDAWDGALQRSLIDRRPGGGGEAGAAEPARGR